MNAEETFSQGCKILEAPLVASGFQFISGQAGESSGGHFASGAYVRQGRKFEVHFRHSLGLVWVGVDSGNDRIDRKGSLARSHHRI
jgi:hypothetical protein